MAQLDSRSLTEFLLSGSWSDSRRLLVLHPEFLDPATDELVEGLIATRRQNGDELQAKVLEQQLGLLRRCRQVGVDAAFAELSGQPRTFVMEEPEAVRRQAEDAQRHYERTGDVRSLEVAVDLWFRVYMDLDDPPCYGGSALPSRRRSAIRPPAQSSITRAAPPSGSPD
jgi:hypothetical protein